jgi:hypothetical protein
MNKAAWLAFGICIICTILLAASVASAESFGTYPINSNVSLIFSCQNSSYLNISRVSTYPNSEVIINSEKSATRINSVYNYTIPASNNSIIGTYIVNYHCDVNGIDTPSVSSYDINNTGFQFSTGDAMILILAFVAIGILVLIFFTFGIKQENPVLKIFCLAMATMFLVFLFGYGYNMFNLLLGKYPAMSSGLSNIYVVLIALLTVGGIGLVVWLLYFAMTMWWKHRGLLE